jgi:hypothetical protein
MDRSVALRAAASQLALVALVSIVLALLLPRSFFESWGWLSGPTAWALCAYATARILSLPVLGTLLGALVAGLPSLVFVIAGLHWLGALMAVSLFAIWCGVRAAARPGDGERKQEPLAA